MNVIERRSSRILLSLACLFTTSAHATTIDFTGVIVPGTWPYDITTQGYTFEMVTSDPPAILSSPGPSPHGSDAYGLCGYCSTSQEFNIYKDNGGAFNLTSMELGASGNTSDEFDFTFTGNLAGGGTIVQTFNNLVPTSVTTVNFNSAWQNLASVNVVVDTVGNAGISSASFDDIVVNQAVQITYANVSVPDGAGTNTDLKPIFFEGLMFDGVSYDVTIIWGGSYETAYASGGPIFETTALFWPSPESVVAVNAILDALVEDGYTPLPPLTNDEYGAFVMVPGVAAFGAKWGESVELDLTPLALRPTPLLGYAEDVDYPFIGWTRFEPAAPPPQVVQITHEDILHPHHIGGGTLPDDQVSVIVYGSSIADGDAADFYTDDIVPATVRFGPDLASIDPASTPQFNLFNDGDIDEDARFHFKMADTGMSCPETELSLEGETLAGDAFEGTDTTLRFNCNAGCH